MNEVNQLRKDGELLITYFDTERWTLFDDKISEIIKSKNINRLSRVLKIFTFHSNTPELKICLKDIKNEIKKLRYECQK